jgi:hypothetical protein
MTDNPEFSSQNTPSSVPWKEILMKATLTATIAGVAANFLIPGGSVNVAGMSVPQAAAIGLGAASGSIAGDLAHKYVLPHIPQNEKYVEAESAVVSVGAAIAGAYVAMNMIGDTPIMTPVMLGGGSYLLSDYVMHHVIATSSGGFIY